MIGMTANARCLLSAASLSVIAVLGATMPMSAAAQQARGGTITVPAMPMAKAIEQISAQAGVVVNYDPDAVKSLSSKPVREATSVRAALEAATAGRPLAIEIGDNGALTVVNNINDIIVTARRDEAETSVLVRQATTSDRSGLGLRDQPRNTQVISAKTIADQQALNITDILRNAGGVSATANDGNAGASYTVRGFSAAGLVNGLSGSSQNSIAGSANQPIANIERVEILKGPDALIAGFGNLGGNVNVVTKKPSAEQRLAVSLDAGSFGLVRGVIDANNAITADKKLSGRVVASAQKMEHNYGGYDNNDDYLFAPSLRYKDRLTDIVIGASLSKAVTGIGAYTLFDINTANLIERDPSVPIYTPHQGLRANIDRFYFDLTREIVPGVDFVARGLHETSRLEVRVVQLGYSRRGILRAQIGGSLLESTSDAVDSFVRIKTHVGDGLKASFNVGYNYSRGSTDQRGATDSILVPNPPLGANTGDVRPFSPFGDVSLNVTGKQEGVYGQALLEFWKIKLLGGVRKTWFETGATFFFPGADPTVPDKRRGTSPSAGIIFDVTPEVSVFANYARGTDPSFGTSRTGEILPDITTTNKEVGVKIDLFSKRATINASYFDITQDNIQVTDPVDPNFQIPGPGQRGRGIDLNIAGQLLPGWTVLGSLTRTKYTLLSPDEFETTVRRQPRDTYSIYSIYRTKIADGLSGGMSAGLYGRSSSFADPLGIYVVPAARQVDVNGFVTWQGFDINLGVRNIFDRRNYNTANSIGFVPVDEPRGVRLTITKRLF
nr:TonB-dependent receptor [Sphingomonas populi]